LNIGGEYAMRYYIIEGKQIGQYGSWNEANMKCEAPDPIAARKLFDEVFKMNGYLHKNDSHFITSIVEDLNWVPPGGLERE
jgi:hypothetical protein